MAFLHVYFPHLYTLYDLNACSQILDRSALLRPRMFACGFTGAIGSREMKQALQIQNREPVNFLVCRMCLLSERLLPDSSLFSIPKEDPQETKLWTRESLQTAHSYSYNLLHLLPLCKFETCFGRVGVATERSSALLGGRYRKPLAKGSAKLVQNVLWQCCRIS